MPVEPIPVAVADCDLANRPMVLGSVSPNLIASSVECELHEMDYLAVPMPTNLVLVVDCAVKMDDIDWSV